MSYKDKVIYKISDINFVEIVVVGYILLNGVKTYRILYNNEIIDVDEDKLLTKNEWVIQQTKAINKLNNNDFKN